MKLNDNEYSKVTGPEFEEKKSTPLLGAEMVHLKPKKEPFGKKLKNASLDFLLFLE